MASHWVNDWLFAMFLVTCDTWNIT